MELNKDWNDEELDHYKSMTEHLIELELGLDDFDIHEIAYYSADLLRFKRQF